MRSISIGNQSFASVREKSCFYIDKTDFIREWWESNDVVTLITRPRRFGKTLNMDTLNCFFSTKYADRSDLFEGLSIWEDGQYRDLQGKYPVIFLSFAAVKTGGFANARKQICMLLANLYEEHRALLNTDLLSENEKAEYCLVTGGMDDAVAAFSLQKLMGYMSRYYGKKVLMILDEYDTPMQEAYVGGYWEEMTAFIRSLFNATFKTNPYLERAVMTGITRVSKESIFSDLNNLKVVTATTEKYEFAFGFSESEVFQVLDEFGFSDQREEVKNWYDGFTFGKKSDIYNPWSITNFLDTGKLDTYWANTSANSLAGALIQKGNIHIKKAMEDLLEGKSLLTELDEQIVFNQLEEDETAVWSLLLASGYLKQIAVKEAAKGIRQYELMLTNEEVYIMFRNMIRKWFRRKDSSAYSEFIQAFLRGDIKAMNHYMNKVALHTFSYFDIGSKPSEQEPERFYHGFVLGLIVELRGRYHITSNRESGFGRYDVMLEPLSARDTAYILEFKVHDGDEERDLQDTVAAAHRQMKEKQYDAHLTAKGIAEEKIRHYGFAFHGKRVLIG